MFLTTGDIYQDVQWTTRYHHDVVEDSDLEPKHEDSESACVASLPYLTITDLY